MRQEISKTYKPSCADTSKIWLSSQQISMFVRWGLFIRKKTVTLEVTVAVLQVSKNVSKLEHESKSFQANEVS